MTMGMSRRSEWERWHNEDGIDPDCPPSFIQHYHQPSIAPIRRLREIDPIGYDKNGIPLLNNRSGLGMNLNWGRNAYPIIVETKPNKTIKEEQDNVIYSNGLIKVTDSTEGKNGKDRDRNRSIQPQLQHMFPHPSPSFSHSSYPQSSRTLPSTHPSTHSVRTQRYEDGHLPALTHRVQQV